ncbi:MAG: phosphate uptake regulator PhoU, partial [Nanoarchaeota archaeon]|nr:phosphate uptake regulator PhoU [Nanoarchaeota archaeon]
KIFSNGQSALGITLPSKWYQRYNLKKGDELEITLDENRLIAYAGVYESPVLKTSIDITKLSKKVIRWILSSLQKKGYDEIKIVYSSKSESETVRELLQTMMVGFIIVENAEGYLVIKSLSRDDEEVFQNLLRRAFFVTMEMASETLSNIQEMSFEKLSGTIKLEDTNNQLANICERLINKGCVTKDPAFYYTIIWNLEKVCDDYKYICSLMLEDRTGAISDELIALFAKINAFLRGYYELFYDFEFKRLLELDAEKGCILDIIYQLSGKGMSKRESLLLHYLHSNMLKIVDFSTSTIAIRNVD